jgi:hypothetical protein
VNFSFTESVNMEKFYTMLSQRGQLLIFEKYKFRKYRVLKTSEETVWRCTNKNCIATIYTLNSVFFEKRRYSQSQFGRRTIGKTKNQ